MARNAQGEFIWYELLTSDVKAAAAFYGSLLGWSCQAVDTTAPDGYHLFRVDDREVGGLMQLPTGSDCPAAEPGWIGYIGVDDVDATARALLADGASQLVPPTDIPGVGRFAVIADPQGAVFTIMRGAMEERSRAFSPGDLGHCQWNELATSDLEVALAFYSRHFGWSKADRMPICEDGIYQILEKDGCTFGAIMNILAQDQRPAWGFYFAVEDIDAALARATAGGGRLLHEPSEIPGGEFILHGLDPQGARFALVGPRKQV